MSGADDPMVDSGHTTPRDPGAGELGRCGDPATPSPQGVDVPLPTTTLLDSGSIPVEELAAFTVREASRPRPAYLAHRWFARRFGSAMRALLIGACTPADGDFWSEFYGEGDVSLSGLHVLDPFVGGGTIAYEAQRLGASVTGVDVDPVACAITGFELRAGDCPDPAAGLDEVRRSVGKRMASYYGTALDGEERTGLHYFWVQQVTCKDCSTLFDAHPSHLLGIAGRQAWVVCPACGDVHSQDASAERVECGCGHTASLERGASTLGVATCPSCGKADRLLDIARRGDGPPAFRMFAVESIPVTDRHRVPMTKRVFHRASETDLGLYRQAQVELAAVTRLIPKRPIPRTGRSDNRLVDYGYRRYAELFNARQLLHLVTLARAIRSLDGPQRELLGLAFSNHLTSNCMLTSYTPKWRQATPLFVVRSFRHSVRPVELNPWLEGIGRGTFPNAVRKVSNAISYTKSPVEFTATGSAPVPRISAGPATVINGDSRDLRGLADASVDLVVTDPPYLDNIAYSELADFFVPWLADTGVLAGRRSLALSTTLATKDRTDDAVQAYGEGLTACFSEARRVLRSDGRMIFTFQHATAPVWHAIAFALRRAGFTAINVFPLKGDGDKGLHHHAASSTWDAVFVLRPAARTQSDPSVDGASHVEALDLHVTEWSTRLGLALPDREVLRRAAYVAGATGFLAKPGQESKLLAALL